ncbi:HD domain-containing protein [Falsiroseomonas sp.]|uniref:HD domain-containing protein n=1 Tax=Falsiroseomonas sp. TaxID=2870721 RepID=UPI003F712EBD
MTPAIFADLRHRHAEPHRAWHDWARISGLLAMAEEVSHALADKPAFILAILFHTAVFDRANPEAEAESLRVLHRHLGRSLPKPMLARAEALIHAVLRQELPETEDPGLRADAALLLDMDQAVLGEPAARFAAYEAAIRREYAHLAADRYRAGRIAALQMLLWRDRIYHTDRFHLAREKRARGNIAARLRDLEAGQVL